MRLKTPWLLCRLLQNFSRRNTTIAPSQFYAKTVRQELKRLNELVGQLIAFSTPLSYDYSVVDLHEIINLGISFLQEQGMGQKTTVETADDLHNLKVRADRILLARAFSYLIRYLFRAVEDGGVIQITTAVVKKYYPGGSVYILLRDSQTSSTRKCGENVRSLIGSP